MDINDIRQLDLDVRGELRAIRVILSRLEFIEQHRADDGEIRAIYNRSIDSLRVLRQKLEMEADPVYRAETG
jgi:hypothetical protein